MDNSEDNQGYLPREALEELKQIHYKETGTWLTDDEAETMGRDLFRFFKALSKRPPK